MIEFNDKIIFFALLATFMYVNAAPSSHLLESILGRDSANFTIPPAIDFDIAKTPFPSTYVDNDTFTFKSATKGNVDVPDPFHWFEDVNGSASKIKAFNESQSVFLDEYLTKVTELDSIRSSIKKADTYKFISLPQPFGKQNESLNYLYSIVEEGKENYVYYLATEEEIQKGISTNFSTNPGKKILDDDLVGTNKTAFYLQLSPDGQNLLYLVSDNVTGISNAYVRNISTPLTVESGLTNNSGTFETIPNAFKIGWAGDSKTIFYVTDKGIHSNITAYLPSFTSEIYYHVLGTDVKEDIAITNSTDFPEDFWDFTVSDDFNSIVLYLVTYSVKRLQEISLQFIASLDKPISTDTKWLPVPSDPTRDYFYLTNIGSDYYFKSNKKSTGGNVVHYSIDLSQGKQASDFHNLKADNISEDIIVPETNSIMVAGVSFDTDKVVLRYINDDAPQAFIYDLKTGKQLQDVSPSTPSYLYDLEAFPYSKQIFCSETSLNSPSSLLYTQWDSALNQASAVQYFEVKNDFINPDDYIVQLQLVPSTDGVTVPIYIMHHKDVQLNGSSPAIIETYGAYGLGASPIYNEEYFAFAHDFNGIVVIAGERGGGDKGSEWHEAAVNATKFHTFEDTKAVGNYLVDKKYTSPGQITLYGEGVGAMGGAVMINQDDQGLFRALVAERGLFDMLHLGSSNNNVSYRINELGDPQDPQAFDWLYAYSPINNINKNKPYPLIIVQPGKDDDYNEPWQSYKYLATLQLLLPTNGNPFFLVDSSKDYKEKSAIALATVAHATGQKKVK